MFITGDGLFWQPAGILNNAHHNLPSTNLYRNGVVRGASSFDNYTIPEGFPLPEKAEDPLADAYIENTERYFKSMDEERSECATPKAPQPSNSRWSDVTPTESFSRSGRYSWESVESADEEVSLDINICI